MASAHPPAIQHRRTVLALALAAASTWIFVLGVTIPQTLGGPATVQAATACAAATSCSAAGTPGQAQLVPAAAPHTIRVSVPTP